MLHNIVILLAVSSPYHMIAVMTDDGLICRRVCLVEHSRTTMLIQFHEAISYAVGKVGIECFEPILMASCAGNHESRCVCKKLPHSWVLTAFQQCRTPVHKKRKAPSCFACLQPGHRRDTLARLNSVHGASHEKRQLGILSHTPAHTNNKFWLVPHFFLWQLTAVLFANVTKPSPGCKGERAWGRVYTVLGYRSDCACIT